MAFNFLSKKTRNECNKFSLSAFIASCCLLSGPNRSTQNGFEQPHLTCAAKAFSLTAALAHRLHLEIPQYAAHST